jgi:hypothetical protein
MERRCGEELERIKGSRLGKDVKTTDIAEET